MYSVVSDVIKKVDLEKASRSPVYSNQMELSDVSDSIYASVYNSIDKKRLQVLSYLEAKRILGEEMRQRTMEDFRVKTSEVRAVIRSQSCPCLTSGQWLDLMDQGPANDYDPLQAMKQMVDDIQEWGWRLNPHMLSPRDQMTILVV